MMEKRFSALYPIGYRLLQAALLAGIWINCGRYVGILEIGLPHLLVTIGILVVLAGINYGKINEKIICAGILALVVLIVIPLWGTGQISGFTENYFHWLLGKKEYERAWQPGYELMQCAWISGASYVFQIPAEKSVLLKRGLALLLVVALPLCMFLEIELGHGGVVSALGLIMLCYMEWTRENWPKRKGRDTREYILFLSPFLVVYMVLVLLMPTPEKPYDWQFAKTVYHHMRESLITFVDSLGRNGREDFGLAMGGFSEEGKLQRGLFRRNRELLTVRGGEGLTTNVYLDGKCYDVFDGRDWEQTEYEDVSEYPLDLLETVYAVTCYDQEGIDNYILYSTLNLRYEHFNTVIMFVPAKLKGTSMNDYLKGSGAFRFPETRGYGTEYRTEFYQLNRTNPEFNTLLENPPKEDKELWQEVVDSYYHRIEKNYTLEMLEEYRRQMQEIYLRDVALTEDLRAYVQDITEGCETGIQKLRALEQALSGYEYTRTPGELPAWVESQEEFLEYFLLDSRRGYCSYFATAFVLLARAEGFPARYVEGFCVSTNKDKIMTVTSDMVHAWPEVYIEGVGWIPFEPTPGYGALRYEGWKVKVPMEYENEYYGTGTQWQPPVEEPEISMPEEVLPQETGTSSRSWVILGISLLAMTGICLVLLLIEGFLTAYRYRRMSLKEQFVTEVRRNLWIWARLGYKREKGETFSELEQRVRQGIPLLAEQKPEWAFIQGYQEYLYRRDEVSGEMLKKTIAERELLLDWVKNTEKWQYYLIRFRLVIGGIL
ncbi:MAG: transglutaminase domain-containing protein [Lachnospiraceae bacterium]|nr:transglutaminase domain-containing protein [Lachnospiraceae bacterium]